jgi:hypothetical protein
MKKYGLGFISDEDLYYHTKETVDKYRFSINLQEFTKNIVDPIKLTFDSKVYGKSLEECIESEIIRQKDKSNTNHIGFFHQNIFQYIGKGWKVLEKGYDIEHKRKHIYVEMKNKHNTMNSSSSQKTYMRMQNTLLKDSKATCYLVEVIAKNSQDIVWKNSIDGTHVENDRIRRISIDKFYRLVTNKKNAFKNLCEVLPDVIEDIVNDVVAGKETNTVLDELYGISDDLLTSIYLLAFKNYEGFDVK